MLLANCVRRINKIDIAKCVHRSINSIARRPVSVASSVRSGQLMNRSLPNLTSPIALFTNNNCNKGHLWCEHRYYSNNQSDKGRDDDSDDDDLEHWQRKLPRFDSFYHITPSIYLMVKNALSVLLIRSYFDQHFNRDDFLNGAKQAVEVVSNILADANFDALQDMVDDDTIDKMRRIVGSMTPEQRQLLVVNQDDTQWIFPYEIQFITKESTMTNTSRFFVEIMVVLHAYRDHDLKHEITLTDLLGKPNSDVVDKLEKHYSVANYRFIKEFTKGVDDDWTINHILHVKPTDEMKEKEKLFKET